MQLEMNGAGSRIEFSVISLLEPWNKLLRDAGIRNNKTNFELTSYERSHLQVLLKLLRSTHSFTVFPCQGCTCIFLIRQSQVGSIMGQGSFATVHRAKEIFSGREVALKIVRPEHELDLSPGPNGTSPDISYDDVVNAMRLEITHMKNVGLHPNVIRVFGTAEDCRVLVMERAATDLYNLVKKYPQLPLPLAQRWTRGMLEAVAHIHDMGVVHQVGHSRAQNRHKTIAPFLPTSTSNGADASLRDQMSRFAQRPAARAAPSQAAATSQQRQPPRNLRGSGVNLFGGVGNAGHQVLQRAHLRQLRGKGAPTPSRICAQRRVHRPSLFRVRRRTGAEGRARSEAAGARAGLEWPRSALRDRTRTNAPARGRRRGRWRGGEKARAGGGTVQRDANGASESRSKEDEERRAPARQGGRNKGGGRTGRCPSRVLTRNRVISAIRVSQHRQRPCRPLGDSECTSQQPRVGS